MSEDLVVRSVTISPTTFYAGNTTNYLTSNLVLTNNGYPLGYAPNAVIPESPEVWLRRRVQEVCGLVAA